MYPERDVPDHGTDKDFALSPSGSRQSFFDYIRADRPRFFSVSSCMLGLSRPVEHAVCGVYERDLKLNHAALWLVWA